MDTTNTDSSKSKTGSVVIDRVVGVADHSADKVWEAPKIRPDRFDDYPGQDRIKRRLKVAVEAARTEGRCLGHALLHGPPGLGKTTMANILASEMGKALESTAGPAIERPGDLVGLLTSLQPETVLFIDEIHRLPPKVEEILYSAMEDFQLDLMIGQGPTARSMRMPLSPFTLVGATTRMDMLTSPLRSRFVIVEYMEYYEESALRTIIRRAAGILGIKVTESGAAEIARRSRGTPRVANRLLKRVWDFHVYEGFGEVGEESAARFLEELGVDDRGLDQLDRELLRVILMQYDGGPVGIEALAASIGIDPGTLEDVYEPYLVRREILSRGPRGRSLTQTGRSIAAKYMGLAVQETLSLSE